MKNEDWQLNNTVNTEQQNKYKDRNLKINSKIKTKIAKRITGGSVAPAGSRTRGLNFPNRSNHALSH